MGSAGFEPAPCELRARCAAVTPRPRRYAWYLFESQRVHQPDNFRIVEKKEVARKGVEPLFPLYQSDVLNR